MDLIHLRLQKVEWDEKTANVKISRARYERKYPM